MADITSLGGDLDARPLPKSWGAWVHDRESNTLFHVKGQYPVSLDECTDSPNVLDWIAQVATKTWATDADVGSLVRALDDLLLLQANVCGGGEGKKFDPLAVIAQRYAHANPREK